MTRYKKKPVVIDAMMWGGTITEASDIIDWILQNGGTARYHNDETIAIDTLEGTMKANPHDWIIRGVEGEFYPCKPHIFEATYERTFED